jgi:hypothetical protein
MRPRSPVSDPVPVMPPPCRGVVRGGGDPLTVWGGPGRGMVRYLSPVCRVGVNTAPTSTPAG